MTKYIKPEGVCLVIPVRLASKRFPRKVLAKFNDKALLQHSINIAKKLNFVDKIVVAHSEVPSAEILRLCENNMIDIIHIKEELSCGTEKVHYVKKNKNYKNFEYYITLPVDEPTIDPEELNRVWKEEFTYFKDNYRISTLFCDFYNEDDLKSNLSCKIITDGSDDILYMSRNVIPWNKEGKINDLSLYKKHIGVFIFPNKLLSDHKLDLWKENELSKSEGLEQNMFLSFNFNCYKVKHIGFGIDIPKQIELLEQRMN